MTVVSELKRAYSLLFKMRKQNDLLYKKLQQLQTEIEKTRDTLVELEPCLLALKEETDDQAYRIYTK